MAETFNSVWRAVLQYNRKCPATLARQWVANRYTQILDRRMWSFQWGQGCWAIKTPIFANVSVTQFSNVVTFPAGVLPSDSSLIAGWTMVLIGQVPYYLVTSLQDPTHVTVYPPIQQATNSSLAAVTLLCYFMSEQPDFERMIAIVDQENNWQLRQNVTIEEMDNDDPQRETISPPTRMVPMGFNDQYLAQLPDGVTDYFNQTNASDPQPYFETWPRGPIVQPYPYVYKRKTPTLFSDGDPLPGFLRGHVLYEGALADLCGWPGTATDPNPNANPVYTNMHERKFEDLLNDMIMRDEQVTQRTLRNNASYANMGYAEFESARFWQSHVDASGVLAGNRF